MPRISSFYGITIAMFYGDHDPPHFHPYCTDSSARFGLDGAILDGGLPSCAQRLVRKWVRLHPDELAACLERSP